jgi:hypothetical protein
LKLDDISQGELLEGDFSHLAVVEEELPAFRLNESKALTPNESMNRALHFLALTGFEREPIAATTPRPVRRRFAGRSCR